MRHALLVLSVLPSLLACGGAPSPSILLVTLDTTRADRLGAYGYGDALTPNLDALAARGVRFDAAYTASPMTLPAHATLLTGLEPPEHGVRINGRERLPDGVPTLAETLRQHGYRTAAFVAAAVLARRFGLDRGFEVYDDDLAAARPQTVHEPLSVYRSGDRVVDAALAWLGPVARSRASFFAWVHLYDPHYPDYANPSLAGTRYAGVASYDAEVAFMDQQVGRLLALLDATARAHDTLVVAVADHGEGLGDHGEYEHGYLLGEEVLRVPLLVRWDGHARAGGAVSALVTSADVAPTILDVAGVAPPRPLRGRSLRPALEGGAVASSPAYGETDLPLTVFGWSGLRSLTTTEWKYVRTPRVELYARTADRAERSNVAPSHPDVVAALEAELRTVEASFHVVAAPTVALDDDARRRLEALGYLDAGLPAPAPAAALRDVKDMLPVKQASNEIVAGLATGRLDRETAIARTRELVQRSPESPGFHLRLGTLLLESGNVAEALPSLTEAVRLRPGDAEAQTKLGEALVRVGRPEASIAHLRAALAVDPDRAEAHAALGGALAATGALDEGAAHLATAVRLAPDSADARVNLGNLLLRQGKQAEASYREALRLRPDHALAHYDLATVLARGDEIDEALEHAREAVRLAPALAPAQNLLGRLLAEDGATSEAIAAYEAATRLDPANPDYFDDLAAAYAANGETARAVVTANRAMAKARRLGRDDLARDIRRRIAYYRSQRGSRPRGDDRRRADHGAVAASPDDGRVTR